MRALGFEVKKADVLKVMKDYDKEATGKITFDDFYEVSKYIMIYYIYKYINIDVYLLYM